MGLWGRGRCLHSCFVLGVEGLFVPLGQGLGGHWGLRGRMMR